MSDRLIYHIFADVGVESEALQAFGRVVRVGIDPLDTNDSEPVKADARNLPLKPGADLAVLHPPCQQFSPATKASGNPDDHPNLIPLAREIAEEYADHYIIENVPNAPLNDPVVLDGRMFGLPNANRRAFETSFHVPTKPIQPDLRNHHDSAGWGGTMDYWRTLKGYSGEYPARDFKRSGIPRAFIDHLLRHWLIEVQEAGKRPNQRAVATDGSGIGGIEEP